MKNRSCFLALSFLYGCSGQVFGTDNFATIETADAQPSLSDSGVGGTMGGGRPVGSGGSRVVPATGGAASGGATAGGSGGSVAAGGTAAGGAPSGGVTSTGGVSAAGGGDDGGLGGMPGTGGVVACTLVTHSNGLGQTWQDCVPLGTYDESQAMKACEASGVTSCDMVATCGSSLFEMRGTYNSKIIGRWGYVGALAGYVGTGALGELCLGSSDPNNQIWR